MFCAPAARLRELAQNDPAYFGRVFPFALALGIEKAAAKRLVGSLRERPVWITGPGAEDFTSPEYRLDLCDALTTTLSSEPAQRDKNEENN